MSEADTHPIDIVTEGVNRLMAIGGQPAAKMRQYYIDFFVKIDPMDRWVIPRIIDRAEMLTKFTIRPRDLQQAYDELTTQTTDEGHDDLPDHPPVPRKYWLFNVYMARAMANYLANWMTDASEGRKQGDLKKIIAFLKTAEPDIPYAAAIRREFEKQVRANETS